MTADPAAYTDAPMVVVIADDAAAGTAAAEATGLAGARVAARIGFATAADRLAEQVRLDAIMIETRGADPLAPDVLGRIDTLARDRGVGVVVAVEDVAVDWVAAQMLGRHAQLLCEPSVAERSLALALVGAGDGDRLYDATRDEAERLRMLNAEVARIAEALARLSRNGPEQGPRSALRDRTLGFGTPPAIEVPAPVAAADVRAAIRARRMRGQHFPPDLFADPAWDMLLDLFAAELEHVRVSVSSLCIAAAVPGTTALRWIGTMIDTGLFTREADPFDRRRAYIRLANRASEGMRRYFDAIRRAGLASA